MKKEFDIARVLREIQKVSLLADVLLDAPQQMLLQFQQDYLINADESEAPSHPAVTP